MYVHWQWDLCFFHVIVKFRRMYGQLNIFIQWHEKNTHPIVNAPSVTKCGSSLKCDCTAHYMVTKHWFTRNYVISKKLALGLRDVVYTFLAMKQNDLIHVIMLIRYFLFLRNIDSVLLNHITRWFILRYWQCRMHNRVTMKLSVELLSERL